MSNTVFVFLGRYVGGIYVHNTKRQVVKALKNTDFRGTLISK